MRYSINALYILLLVLIVSCAGNTKEHHEEDDPLKKEVIAIHDEAMDQMGITMRLKSQLKGSLDSARLEEYTVVMERLDNAHESMMVWMRNFSKQFPNATLKGGAHHGDHGPMSGTPDGQKERSEDEEQKLLMEEKEKVIALRKEMNEAIALGKALLNNEGE